jgi:predicted AlkP superfamily pyrophosphatase or phosphodiesterase
LRSFVRMNTQNRFRRQRALLILGGLVLSFAPIVSGRAQTLTGDLKPTVILISIDGFRFDYLKRFKPPNLGALAREGVRARWMTPAFPSLTFPNHYTIATGLYPEKHGIIGNDIYDPVFDALFSVSKKTGVTDGGWWGGEPIWATAEKQGQRTASYFWPGTEAEISGKRPTFWEPYDGDVPNSKRVDTVLSWLDLPMVKRPTFIALYFSDVDTAGHDFSPDSGEVAEAIAAVDTAIGQLIQGLKSRGIYDKVNLIVVSDHGMATLKPRDVVILDESFQAAKAERIVWNAQVTNIFPKKGETAEIDRELSSRKLKHARCYLKEKIPARFHYRHNRRVAPIVCIADQGWRIFSRQRYNDDLRDGKFPSHLIGAHGYDNRLPTMRATFLARGPAFKRRATVPPFTNVNVYGIMTGILGLAPAKNDGTMSVARSVLR